MTNLNKSIDNIIIKHETKVKEHGIISENKKNISKLEKRQSSEKNKSITIGSNSLYR